MILSKEKDRTDAPSAQDILIDEIQVIGIIKYSIYILIGAYQSDQ